MPMISSGRTDTPTEKRKAGRVIKFQLEFMLLMIGSGREDAAQEALEKALGYCRELEKKEVYLEIAIPR